MRREHRCGGEQLHHSRGVWWPGTTKSDFWPNLLRVREQKWEAVEASNEVGTERAHMRHESGEDPEHSLECLNSATPPLPQSCLLQSLGHTESNNQQKRLHYSPGRSLHSLFFSMPKLSLIVVPHQTCKISVTKTPMKFSLDNTSKQIHKLGMAIQIHLKSSRKSNKQVVIQDIRTTELSPLLAAWLQTSNATHAPSASVSLWQPPGEDILKRWWPQGSWIGSHCLGWY